MTLEQVQRAMAASHPPAPTPPTPPPPVEEPEPAPVKPVATYKTTPVSTRVRARATAATPSTKTPAADQIPTPGLDALTTEATAPPTANATAVTTPAPDMFPGPPAATNRTTGLQFSDDPRIYSKDDADVVPARLLTGQNGAAVTNTVTDVNTMELVISKMGRVETAKLSTPPKRMTDMLLLSGAKMWRFTPALKDGQPVRYRTQVSYETIR